MKRSVPLALLTFLTLATSQAQMRPARWEAAERIPVDHFRAQSGRSLTERKSHYILELKQEAERAALERQSVRFLRQLGGSRYLVSIPPMFRAAKGLGATLGSLRMTDKRSELFETGSPDERITAVVTFHDDVDSAAALSVLSAEDIHVRTHPDLEDHDYLIELRRDQVASLSEWDEVFFVFPASEKLRLGDRVWHCPGALTNGGVVAPGTPTVGEGWDGPGLGSATLSYVVVNGTERIAFSDTLAEVERAMREWGHVVNIKFQPTTNADAPRTLRVLFGRGEHGDEWPFDGPGRTLAHTFYPAPLNDEPLAGDLHFDADEYWQLGADTDFYSVALHELGHALGLGHSDNPSAIMYPYYRMVAGLGIPDRDAILSLYAPAEIPGVPGGLAVQIDAPSAPVGSTARLTGTVSGGTAPYQITWSNDRGGEGQAEGRDHWTIEGIALQPGDNQITLRVTDDTHTEALQRVTLTLAPPAVPPTLQITSPASGGRVTAGNQTVVVSGNASHPSGIARVTWLRQGGPTGEAIGTTTWSTGPVELKIGENQITIRAESNAGSRAEATLTVDYQAAASSDKVAPSVVIMQPTSSAPVTSTASIVLKGVARDNVGVTEVSWTNGAKSGTASGTASWQAEIPLTMGANSVTIKARDAAGNVGWRALTVTRR